MGRQPKLSAVSLLLRNRGELLPVSRARAFARALFLLAAVCFSPALARADVVTLSWTAPGDDGTSGRAASYELRFSEQPIVAADTAGWWGFASTAGVLPPPLTAGQRETFSMTGLSTGTIYYFVIRTADEAQNWSGFSNISPHQAGGGSTALATPGSFSAEPVPGAVGLSWQEPISGAGSGYHVYRRTPGGADALLTTLAVAATAWNDTTVTGGVAYEYRLATFQGTAEGVPAVAAVSVPTDRLTAATAGMRGFPNPARGKVTLRFRGGTRAGAPARARLMIYDLTGHLVCQLVDRILPAGEQAITWACRSDTGNAVAPGLYNAILDGPEGRTVTRIAVVP